MRPDCSADLESEELTVALRGDQDRSKLARRRRFEQIDLNCHGGSDKDAPPGTDHVAIEDDTGIQHSTTRVKTLDVLGIQHRVAVLVGDEGLVESRQEV